jgi:hypothetical protein
MRCEKAGEEYQRIIIIVQTAARNSRLGFVAPQHNPVLPRDHGHDCYGGKRDAEGEAGAGYGDS